MVELVADDEGGAALLLERLDATRMLEDVEIDEACAVIGQIVLDVSAVSAPAGVLRAKDELERITTSIRAQWAGVGSVVSEMLAEQALATLADLITDLGAAESTPLPLVHGDLHFRNVLHTLPETEPSAWKAIDPFPFAGLPELDVIAALRNRWTDAQTTGNVDRALRRRVDMICEPAGLDRRLARAAAQAVAVDNLLWLLPDRPEHMFVAPYSVVAEWGN
jgi:streptomycin 6-kinase